MSQFRYDLREIRVAATPVVLYAVVVVVLRGVYPACTEHCRSEPVEVSFAEGLAMTHIFIHRDQSNRCFEKSFQLSLVGAKK
jgi:hypothetical protein